MAQALGLSLVLGTLLLLLTRPAHAVILLGTADPAVNTTAPTGPLANSGWQFQGRWDNCVGTPIAPQFFVTAKHVGGSVGGVFTFNGVAYPTTAYFDGTNNDLRIWQISGTFPTYAPLYTGTGEEGQAVVVHGRGTQRGDDVSVAGALKGWKWGASDGVMRWGENQVSVIGTFLRMTFDANGGANEAHLSSGDSGGGVFLLEAGVWKLAGVNYGVGSHYNETGLDGAGFDAAVFDCGGLYTGADGAWTFNEDVPPAVPGICYATRVAAYLDFIYSVIGTPPPAPVVVPKPTRYRRPLPGRRLTPIQRAATAEELRSRARP